MFHFKSLLGLVLLGTLLSLPAGAESSGGSNGGGGDFTKRAERRQSQRWTLKEWLEQKDRSRMMDMWLSMNSPSPYELMLGASYNSFTSANSSLAPDLNYTDYSGSFSAYAQFVGLSVEYENNTSESYNDLSGLFNLRLLGSSIQGSYLTVHYGLKTHTESATSIRLSQPFAQASIQLYATKQFGFDGLYRSYFTVNDATLGDVKGQLTEGGAFIDFNNFRVFGSWYKDVQNEKAATTTIDKTRTGIRTGLKIFF
jgi:hypothetical protein